MLQLGLGGTQESWLGRRGRRHRKRQEAWTSQLCEGGGECPKLRRERRDSQHGPDWC